MKKNIFKKVTAVILALVVCASVAVTGIAVSSAQTADPDMLGIRTDDLSKPALKDGMWQGYTAEGEQIVFTIVSADNTMVIRNVDQDVTYTVPFEFIAAAGLYQLHAPERADYATMLVISNNGADATVRFEDGTTMELTFMQKTDNFSKAALKDGYWEVIGATDGWDRVIINSDENSIIKMNSATDTGVPCSYEFISAIGNYQLHTGAADYTEIWHLTANYGHTATITTDDGLSLTLSYLGPLGCLAD